MFLIRSPERASRPQFVEHMHQANELLEGFDTQFFFVGGAVANMVGEDVKFEVNPEKQRLSLHNPKPVSLRRENGTQRDIDVFLIEPSAEKLSAVTRSLQTELSAPVGITSMSFEEPQRKFGLFTELFQNEGHFYISFAGIKQRLAPETFDAWKLRADGREIPIYNPAVQLMTYLTRLPGGPKPKDRDKIRNLWNLTERVASVDDKTNYTRLVAPWLRFEKRMQALEDGTLTSTEIGGVALKAAQIRLKFGKLVANSPFLTKLAQGGLISEKLTNRLIGML